MARRKLTIGVRDFALPIPRVGSIETHSGYATPNNSGQDVHRRVQDERTKLRRDYRPEYKLSHVFATEFYDFNVTGFSDGFFEEDEVVEELKTAFDTKSLLAKLEAESNHPYILQLQTYGYIFYLKHGRIPELKMVLVSTRDGNELTLPVSLDVLAYEKWLASRLAELSVEVILKETSATRRKRIADALSFPYSSLRTGQQDLIAAIDTNLKNGKNSLIQAATGLGKTIGVSYPMLKHALARGQKLIYVTPKNSQHSVAEEAILALRKLQPELTSLTMTAKSKLCLKSEMICNPTHCEYARDYYAKIYSDNVIEIATAQPVLTGERFKQLGEQFKVCPFELSVDCVDQVDVVIADYNYVFSPRSMLGKLTGSKFGSTKKPNLVIDEAHNLPARATGYFSPSLSITFLNSVLWNLPMNERALLLGAELIVKDCMKIVDRYRPSGKMRSAKITIDKILFAEQLLAISDLLNRYLSDILEIRNNDPVISLFNEWSAFTEALEFEGEEFESIFQSDYSGGALKIICCDAANKLREVYSSFERTAAFSATLKPFDYYGQMIGFESSTYEFLEFPGPFPEKQRKILVIPQVSTKYTDRESNYQKIATAVEKLVALRQGNYIIFFPSYAFLEEVHSRVNLPLSSVLKQEKEIDKATVDKFLNQFKMQNTPTVLFAVQGGVFAEGVDYPGQMLIGAMIVGPPLPTYDLEREIYREYYEKRYGTGFHYAYIYPAMSKVVQAAGRVIRSETDTGLIVLMDKRFILPEYSQSMPKDWFKHSVRELISTQIGKDVSDFWNGIKNC
jgi:DNA excision repair protein ERCC-2